jgi:uncharacterized membrane protein
MVSVSRTSIADRFPALRSIGGALRLPYARARRTAAWFAEPARLVLVIAFGLYVLFWSEYTTDRFYALQAHVFDLGAYAQVSWQVFHGPLGPVDIWGILSQNGIAFVVSPLVLVSSYPLLLAWQSICLGSATFAIFGIAKILLKHRMASLLLALSYLTFFPVAGINWFDMHYEIYFIPLFLWGYLFYLIGRPVPAYTLLALAGFCRFPFGVFPALFGLMNLARSHTKLGARWLGPLESYTWKADVLLVAVSTLSLVSSYVYIGTIGSVGTFLHLNQPMLGSVPAGDRWTTFLLLYGPFLFLPLLSRRWVLFLLPSLFLAFTSTDPYYVYPQLFFTQYSAVIVPFLYLGFIDGIGEVRGLFAAWSDRRSAPAPVVARRRAQRARGRTLAVVGSCVIIICLLAVVYEPYGPLNSEAAIPYRTTDTLAENTTIYTSLEAALHLIPASEPNVLVQNNMPQAFPRPLGNNGIMMVSGETLAYNFTYLYDRQWVPANIEYVLADAWDYTFTYQGPYPYNMSMEQAFGVLYSQRGFGLLAEGNGIMLLERNYTGAVRYFVPESHTYPASRLDVVLPEYRLGDLITATNVTNGSTVWFGPYSDFLVPGTYNVTYGLRATNVSPSNSMQLAVYESGALQLNSTLVRGSVIGTANTWVNVTLPVFIDNFEPLSNFPANAVNWSGTLDLRSISVDQIEPGPSRFVAGMAESDRLLYDVLALLPAGSSLLGQPSVAQYDPGLHLLTPQDFNITTDPPPPYILADPYLGDYTSLAGSGTGPSTFDLVHEYLGAGIYGIEAESEGIVLLALGYHGSPRIWIPQNETSSPLSFSVVKPQYRTGTLITAANVTNRTTVWFGPYGFLEPGSYRATYRLLVSNASPANFMDFQVYVLDPEDLVTTLVLNGNQIPSVGQWTNVTLEFSVPNCEDFANFPANDVDWAGTVVFSGFWLTQLGWT